MEDFVDGDNDPSDREQHGTHVTGIVGATDETIGVAPDVDLISLRVLDRTGDGLFDKISDALKWVLDNQAEHNITAVNLSFGGGFFSSESDLNNLFIEEFNRLQSDIQNLEAAGVTVVAAAGNSYSTNQNRSNRANIAFPAISSTIAVGAVWQDGALPIANWQDGSIDYTTGADRIPSFSQRLDADNVLFAPGAIITSTVPGGGIGESAGTSQAAPHVAGAVALMQEASLQFSDRLLTPVEINEILRSTADTIIDGDDEDDNVNNTNLAYLRINVYNAISELKRRADNDTSNSYSEDSSYVSTDGNDDEYEEDTNDAIAGAIIIPVVDGAAIDPIRETIGRDATINRSNDVDLYNFQLESPGTVRIEVATDSVSPSDFDSYLRLFDGSGTEIAVNDDIDLNAGNTFSLLETNLEPGAYYVGVSGFGNSDYDPNIAGSGAIGDTGNYALMFGLNNEDDTELLTEEEVNLEDSFSNEDNIVYRFTHKDFGVNFYTSSTQERDYIQNHSSQYEFKGGYFESASESADSLSGAKPVYRFLNRSTGMHLYTISDSERDYISDNLSNYTSEGIAYYGYETQQPDTVPLFRSYNSQIDTHLFSTSRTTTSITPAVFANYEPEGDEGVAFYVEAIETV